MKKVIVIGCPGAGKTTFAEKLQKKTSLPLYYLDAIWHKPDRTHISRDYFDARLQEIMSENEWIIDGNYSRTLETRINHCDTVVFFDLSTEDCLWGATVRLGKERCDMPWIDHTLDPGLEKEIITFSQIARPRIYELIDSNCKTKNVVIFTSRSDSDAWLASLELV